MLKLILALTALFGLASFAQAQTQYEQDTFSTAEGELTITFIGHGTLMLSFQDKIIHIDPWGNLADYHKLPKADIILVTHEHTDHLDLKAIELLSKGDTALVLTEACQKQLGTGLVMKNGDIQMIKNLRIKAVPAYNIQHKRDNGEPFHPKGSGNGYIINFADLALYIAGDTENIPEMAELKDIDIAFLPMNLPYTMTPEMVAQAAKMFKPKILYPYHFGNSDTGKLIKLMEDRKDIEVRIRKLS
ncbi:MAG TPA: MBL fold metallo-hydrolase [Atribacterota bacterium]|nr:MBL fold metallo-hydrolase [Atribacterota bacterium]